MTNSINKIVIVGGGSAGWLCANILAKKLNLKNNNELSIQLIESPDIPIIGVGEGTVPAIRDTLKLIEISETEFIRECDATFKQSINFIDWLRPQNNAISHSYHHLFSYPQTPGFDLLPYWLKSEKQICFADAVSFQSSLCQLGKAPKKITTPEFKGIADYAYHLNAGKFAKLLEKHAVQHFGVEHLSSKVIDVDIAEDGNIRQLTTDSKGIICGDFFIDCSGFSSLLLGKSLNVPFKDKGDVLFVDSALAIQQPYPELNSPIPSHTISTAKEAGWIWDIGLSSRRGIGYVYSSSHTTENEAEKCLSQYLNLKDDVEFRKIPMRIGYREKFWENNCVALGLSAGFVEPLEATALLLVEASCKMLADIFPSTKQAIPSAAKRFNSTLEYGWERVVDFIKLHYYLSDRIDSDFWRDNRDKSSVPNSLLEKLELWKFQPPSEYDFPSRYEIFGLENYQYVLYGMNYFTDISKSLHDYPNQAIADNMFTQIQTKTKEIQSALLTNRELLDKIYRYGLPKN